MKKLIPFVVLVALAAGFLFYTGMFYHAEPSALRALHSDDVVLVERKDYGWFFDGPSEENVLVFYPGAKVEETAYGPLLHRLAKQGMDVCLVKMPFRLAFFGADKADDVKGLKNYKNRFIGGHSLGGVMAADYAARHSGKFDGVILLAAYPAKSLKKNISLLSIFGSEDGVLNLENVSDAKKYVHGKYEEHIIKGGNHAFFGNYGMQKGDNIAKITPQEQQKETVEVILSWVPKENNEPSTQENDNETTTEEGEMETGMTLEEIMELDAGMMLTEEDMNGLDKKDLFTAQMIPDIVFTRMEGISFGEECTTSRDDLRYLRLLHTGFDGETYIGEMVCHKDIASDLLDIFYELYQEKYPIEKIRLVDEYSGDDELSMEDNNSSCFNFRPVAGTKHLSNHAYGKAVDINPLYNPYITSSGYTPVNAGDYVDRDADNPYKIDEDDLCYKLFIKKGFSWGGNWNSVKDYQHFEKE